MRGDNMIPKAVRSTTLFVALLLAFWFCTTGIPACAQIGNASLGGTVTDQSGSAVAGADLTLTSQATKQQAKATSNERGEYTFRNLTPGTYDLSVSKAGFQSYAQTGIIITTNASARADAIMKV